MAEQYYKTIDGVKYDAKILQFCEECTKGAGDGRISKADAEKLYEMVKDGNSYTDVEKKTIRYVRENFAWTPTADEWFRTEIRNWALTK